MRKFAASTQHHVPGPRSRAVAVLVRVVVRLRRGKPVRTVPRYISRGARGPFSSTFLQRVRYVVRSGVFSLPTKCFSVIVFPVPRPAPVDISTADDGNDHVACTAVHLRRDPGVVPERYRRRWCGFRAVFFVLCLFLLFIHFCGVSGFPISSDMSAKPMAGRLMVGGALLLIASGERNQIVKWYRS